MPGIMLGKLFPAAPFGTLESRQLMTAAALLAKPLQLAGPHELLLLDMHLANVAALMVGAEVAQLLATRLHLAEWRRLGLQGEQLRCLVLRS